MSAADIDLVDIRLLRLFEAIYATGSITKAAEALGLAQPTVSVGLGRLRVHFGDPLFVRGPEGMLPTPLADQLIGPMRDTLQALRQIAGWRAEFQPAIARRVFRIAMTDASHITLLPPIMTALRDTAPSIVLEASRIDDRLPEALQSGDVDLALGFIPTLERGFFQQVLFAQDWICLAARAHPRLYDGLTLTRYSEERHIGVIAGTGHGLLEAAIRDQGINRRVALRLPGFLGLATILAGSDLIATLPRHIGTVLADLGGLAVHECPFLIPGFSVKLHWHGRYHHDLANRWLRRLCARLFVASEFAAGTEVQG